MKPNREAADAILKIIDDAKMHPDHAERAGFYAMKLLTLASALIPTDDTYGHAKRLHELTGGDPDAK